MNHDIFKRPGERGVMTSPRDLGNGWPAMLTGHPRCWAFEHATTKAGIDMTPPSRPATTVITTGSFTTTTTQNHRVSPNPDPDNQLRSITVTVQDPCLNNRRPTQTKQNS